MTNPTPKPSGRRSHRRCDVSERMIPCPECGKHLCPGCSWEIRERGIDPSPECPKCIAACLCKGSGTIPDRRRATPNDRAVERIKEYLRHRIDHVLDGNSYDDINAFFEVNVVLDIIREEAERDQTD